MSNINKRVWNAQGCNYLRFGTVSEEKVTNGWIMVNVQWASSSSSTWERVANLGSVNELLEAIPNESW